MSASCFPSPRLSELYAAGLYDRIDVDDHTLQRGAELFSLRAVAMADFSQAMTQAKATGDNSVRCAGRFVPDPVGDATSALTHEDDGYGGDCHEECSGTSGDSSARMGHGF